MRIRIEYCAASGYLDRAVRLTEKLLKAFTDRISGLEMVPSGSGVFEVDFDRERVFSRRELGCFPEDEEILSQARSQLGPTQSEEGYRKMREIGERALGDWLYPNAQYGGGGWADDLGFVHVQGQTADSLDQVREYYWNKIDPSQPLRPGSSYRTGGGKPWFVFRSPQGQGGAYSMVMYITDERSISVFMAPSAEDNTLSLYITVEVH